MTEKAALNTDRELWREREGDYYADSIFVTESGGIGINCGGTVIVRPLREWFESAAPSPAPAVGEIDIRPPRVAELEDRIAELKTYKPAIDRETIKRINRMRMQEAQSPSPAPAVGELLPDCMMPDGAGPCIGYQQTYERCKQYRARIEQLEAASGKAPAVGELVLHCDYTDHPCGTDTRRAGNPCDCQSCRAAARIEQLEAGLEAALPYVEAANRAEHLMDGFGPRSRQSSDDHIAAIRALLKDR